MLSLNGRTWRFHGHAIVSADDRIADRTGETPPSLRNEADWARFQAALDASVLTVLGRLGHEANPNRKRRNRLVLSSAVSGVARRADGWWWNPADMPLGEALRAAAPAGGIVAIPGGRRVFDLFLAVGYDAFDLARAESACLPEGTPVFSAVSEGFTAEALLAAHGLRPGERTMLDPSAKVSLTVWSKPADAAPPA
jgi:hypothetical protein